MQSTVRTALHRLYERFCNGLTALHRLYKWLYNGSVMALRRLHDRLYNRPYKRLHKRPYNRPYERLCIVSTNGPASSLRTALHRLRTALRRLYDGSTTTPRRLHDRPYNRLYERLYNDSTIPIQSSVRTSPPSSLRTALQRFY